MRRFAAILILGFPLLALANNVRFAQLELKDSATISADIAWDNSWELEGVVAPDNHDAVWVFAKIQYTENGPWQHLDLSNFSGDHATGGNNTLTVEAVSDGKGVFVKRAVTGTGDNPPINIQLKLTNSLMSSPHNIRVFGIEMVYVPEGGFYAGDSLSNSALANGADLGPLWINSENTIDLGSGMSELSPVTDDAPVANVPSVFPKGYAGFYCMKYELGQEQYRDFLNCLTYEQQTSRTAVAPSSPSGKAAMTAAVNTFRNGVEVRVSGEQGVRPAYYGCEASEDGQFNDAEDGQNRACNWLNWGDLAAYLDWAALRPMTELEFEKVCRGPEAAVPLGFAWGTDAVVDANNLIDDGSETEGVQESIPSGSGLASHGYAGPQGPLRCGFGGSITSDRLTIGGAYYGALEMSGNLWEMCVNLSTDGLGFTGLIGNGELDAQGNANVVSWPTADGVGFKGGGWNSGVIDGFRDLSVSDRFYIYLNSAARRNTSGGRGVRTF